MTQRQTTRSRVMRRVGAAIAATIAVSTVASTGSQAASTSAAKAGGEIKVAIFDTFPGYCMANNPANSSLMATRTMFETLVEKTRGNDFVGLLASSWTSSADLKTWTFNLRQGVKFHNGEDFNATAVKLQHDYSRGGAFAVAAGSLGAAAARTALGYTLGTSITFQANILATTVVSPFVVSFTLDRAQNDFPGTLYASGRGFYRAPAQITSRATCSTTPIGTGPFKFQSGAVPGNDLVVVKNENYWRTDPNTGAKLPYLDKITFTNVKEGSQRAAAVRKGTYDAGMFTSATEGRFIKDLRQRKSVVTEFRSPAEYYPSIWLNQTKAGSPFGNKDARLAVIKCIDRKNFVKVRSRGEATAADSLVGPSSVMYTKRGFSAFNVKAARDHVAAYTAATGKPLSFSYPTDTSTASQGNATFLKKQWEKCGITANIVVEETATVIAKAFNSAKVGGEQMEYDALSILLFEGTDVAFNLPFMVTNMYSNNPLKAAFGTSLGTLLNLNHHTDTAVDTLMFAGNAANSKAAAAAKYKEAVAYMQTNGFMTAIQRQYYTLFTTKNIAGIGKLQIEKGKTQRIVTNWGIDWTGVYKK